MVRILKFSNITAMTTQAVLEQEIYGVPFETTVGGETVELREPREDAFRIENVHGQLTVIINPEFAFAFPKHFAQIGYLALSTDTVIDGPAVRAVVSSSFIKCLDLSSRFTLKELELLQGLEHGDKTLLYRFCSLHMLMGLEERDNIKFSNQDLLELAKDQNLNKWVIRHFSKDSNRGNY